MNILSFYFTAPGEGQV